ncbi:hypothetical protein DY000_02060859 [Brassica cretica]|uniref:Uncharacterized protein n=1 Tax=Brassica cretica TaxID=69181 RepID=A0ABQ7AXT8_BRACR|nr:hypothetical protein DY000_02060859 [Brassica cretica]
MRGSCQGDEGLSIDGTALVSVDGDAIIWAEHIYDRLMPISTFRRNMVILELFENFELAFQCHQFEVNQHLVAEVMLVLRRSGVDRCRTLDRERKLSRRGMYVDRCRTLDIDRYGC